eukprot:TRINITY_DN1788_c0_g1_i1.p1 TRINITY_DN1788_c0_g1~~TRINITY_DN1788_c0_g1_i1.p1  ORF type:complete len:588 (-),score=145.46 TRINITY_DN1788_c0_g1_i1:266-1822(-)
MACPEKYRNLKSFHKYYHGDVVAPVLTIFVGGNHESSGYMRELFYGGWAAPNIYYLGACGCVNVGGLRIAGWSGVYERDNFYRGYFEKLPYTSDEKSDDQRYSVCNIRELEGFKLSLLKGKVDVMLSHDWLRGIIEFGDKEDLYRKKPRLNKYCGAPAFMNLAKSMQPRYWFAAHMHMKWSATIEHSPESKTEFLALNKSWPVNEEYPEKNTDFLELMKIEIDEEIPDEGTLPLCFDLEWLAITKKTHRLIKTQSRVRVPWDLFNDYVATESDIEEICNLLRENEYEEKDGQFLVPKIFEISVDRPTGDKKNAKQPLRMPNPQTNKFLDTFKLPHVVTISEPGIVTDALFNRVAPGKMSFIEASRMRRSQRQKANGVLDSKEKSNGSQPGICSAFQQAGYCKFGDRCKYIHDNVSNDSSEEKRPCTFFMRNGSCKFGDGCKYSHDQRSVVETTPSAATSSSFSTKRGGPPGLDTPSKPPGFEPALRSGAWVPRRGGNSSFNRNTMNQPSRYTRSERRF